MDFYETVQLWYILIPIDALFLAIEFMLNLDFEPKITY